MDNTRIDLWLKYVCLYKHRSAATDACRGGHVKLGGQRVKPSSSVHPDDIIEITEPRYRKMVVVEVPPRQLSKEAARAAYRDETPPPDTTPDVRFDVRDRGSGRPSRKDRRDMRKWKRDW